MQINTPRDRGWLLRNFCVRWVLLNKNSSPKKWPAMSDGVDALAFRGEWGSDLGADSSHHTRFPEDWQSALTLSSLQAPRLDLLSQCLQDLPWWGFLALNICCLLCGASWPPSPSLPWYDIFLTRNHLVTLEDHSGGAINQGAQPSPGQWAGFE